MPDPEPRSYLVTIDGRPSAVVTSESVWTAFADVAALRALSTFCGALHADGSLHLTLVWADSEDADPESSDIHIAPISPTITLHPEALS